MIDFATPTDKHLPVHQVTERPRHAWLATVAVLLTWAMLAGHMDSTDAALAESERQRAQHAAELRRQAAPPYTATVRLVPNHVDGYECRDFNVRHEWQLAARKKCEELAAILIIGRATP